MSSFAPDTSVAVVAALVTGVTPLVVSAITAENPTASGAMSNNGPAPLSRGMDATINKPFETTAVTAVKASPGISCGPKFYLRPTMAKLRDHFHSNPADNAVDSDVELSNYTIDIICCNSIITLLLQLVANLLF